MKLIVGLGNPGILYTGSKHNIGFGVVRHLAKAQKVTLKKERGLRALSAKTKINDFDVLLALPLTFMNLSGEAVAALLKKYKVALADLLIVGDELDLEFGRLKIRPRGTSAGHRGIKSIIDHLGKDEFSRVRIGIGRPKGNFEAAGFVLAPFNKREKAQLPGIIHAAAECCRYWVNAGSEKSMNIFNRNNNTDTPR